MARDVSDRNVRDHLKENRKVPCRTVGSDYQVLVCLVQISLTAQFNLAHFSPRYRNDSV